MLYMYTQASLLVPPARRSLAKMNHHPGDAFLQAMGQEAAAKAKDGNAQNVANLIWAYATLGAPRRAAARFACFAAPCWARLARGWGRLRCLGMPAACQSHISCEWQQTQSSGASRATSVCTAGC